MERLVHIERPITFFSFFAGMGGTALGAQWAEIEWRGLKGKPVVLGGVDWSETACKVASKLTGVPFACMDLYTREQYIAHHGHEPPDGWREVTVEDLWRAAQYQRPDVIAITGPCKGASGLNGHRAKNQAKYDVMNQLTERAYFLAMAAWGDHPDGPPSVIWTENVPGIMTGEREHLQGVDQLMRSYGYESKWERHDLGERGGLHQHRNRAQGVHRDPRQVPDISCIYRAPKRRVGTIGELLGKIPLPGDPAAGPLHRARPVKLKTLLRANCIPPGGDHHDLAKIKSGEIVALQGPAPNVIILRWARDVAAGVPLPNLQLGHNPMGSTMGAYYQAPWARPFPTLTADPHPRKTGGAAMVADPRIQEFLEQAIRMGCEARNGVHGVQAWDRPAFTMTAHLDFHSGPGAVADPRIGELMQVTSDWLVISPWNTANRMLTILDMLAIQSFPLTWPDGSPIHLEGVSDSEWREMTGNAVPPRASQASMEAIGRSILAAEAGDWLPDLFQSGVWVRPEEEGGRLPA